MSENGTGSVLKNVTNIHIESTTKHDDITLTDVEKMGVQSYQDHPVSTLTDVKVPTKSDSPAKSSTNLNIHGLKGRNINYFTTNVAYHLKCGCNLDLKKLATRVRRVKYRPECLAAVLTFPRRRNVAFLLKDGTLEFAGAKGSADAIYAASKYKTILKNQGIPAQLIISVSCNLKFCIRLEALQCTLPCLYEPELHPALIYNMDQTQTNLQIFPSGKIVINGSKRKDIDEAFDNIYPILQKFHNP